MHQFELSEGAYHNRMLDGLALKILNAKSDCPQGRALCAWIQGASEAIEKTYLRELILAIYTSPDQPEEAVETYTFHFEYYEESDQVKVSVRLDDEMKQDKIKSKNKLYKNTRSMLKQILQVQAGMFSTYTNMKNWGFASLLLVFKKTLFAWLFLVHIENLVRSPFQKEASFLIYDKKDPLGQTYSVTSS